MTTPERIAQGRPPATSHAAIESAAFKLFARHGFDTTTAEEIAEAVGIGRRTLFRYYPSKNDIPWGEFDASLARFRETLDAAPTTLPVIEVVQNAVVDFNRFRPDTLDQHRQRMQLILRTPALQAHSVHRYKQWREVIAEYVAKRYDVSPTDLLPRTVGHVSLALALSAYEQWLERDDAVLEELLDESMSNLVLYVTAPRKRRKS